MPLFKGGASELTALTQASERGRVIGLNDLLSGMRSLDYRVCGHRSESNWLDRFEYRRRAACARAGSGYPAGQDEGCGNNTALRFAHLRYRINP